MARLRQDPAYREQMRRYLHEYGRQPVAKEKRIDRQRVYRQSPEYHERDTWNRRRHRYGLEREQIEAMYDRQCASCALCLSPLAFGRMHIDHDHTTGEVRGLLHPACNMTVGRRYGDRY